MSVSLAWGCVALRVVHSVIQTTVNIVACRFWTFFASTLLLVGLVVRNLAAM